MLFKIAVRLGVSGRCSSNGQLGQFPLPPGEGQEGSRSECFSQLKFGSEFQVGVARMINSVSPLSLRERAEEGSRSECFSKSKFGSELQIGVVRMINSVSPFSLRGKGPGREPICVLFKIEVRLGASGRCSSNGQLGQFPLPPGKGQEGSRSVCFSKSQFGSELQIGVVRMINSVSPFSLRGKGQEGSRSVCFSKLKFGSEFQVGVARMINSVSSLSLRERARVRGSSQHLRAMRPNHFPASPDFGAVLP